MNNDRALKICQQRRDYSEDPLYWEDDEDYEDEDETEEITK